MDTTLASAPNGKTIFLEKLEKDIHDDPKLVSLAFIVGVEKYGAVTIDKVEDPVAFIESHTLESLMRYFDIADMAGLDMSYIIKKLKAIYLNKYRLMFEAKESVQLDDIEENAIAASTYFGFSKFLSNNTLEILGSEKFIHMSRKMDVTLTKLSKHFSEGDR